ncbi:hypothetical protein J2T02_003257 [Chitinophaga terrae (ex Kim and Jung 2007)]|uniref:hypothetical protein n=1 Tax=Chitinophaga terrae (ex Kim and Jung 2007) TaxID=408074 RepID=UPI0027851531|nr:hypothetical protein [Chitinophaga terrae (ex Kim and Jung 2007)]MDQ0108135.1 hypothetical protein [Chitinophaga terrae (ex Kim and Jung 2007)]
MKNLVTVAAFTLLASAAFAQEKLPVVIPYNPQNIRELYLDSSNHHTAFKPILHVDTSAMYTQPDTAKRSWFHRKLFNEHLLEFRHPDYNVFIDFLPDFQIGKSRDGSRTTWLNTRGAVIQANIGPKVYFESYFYENQGKFPTYLDQYIRQNDIVPGQGGIKSYSGGKAFDFNYASALLSYTPNKFLNLTAGYGQNFIGDGYRSLILSDISFSYPYLKITANLGSVQYTAMWAQFMDKRSKDFVTAYEDLGYFKKWGVFHFLDWNVNKKLTIGLFDAVIWPDADSSSRKRGFDWSYLNPIIFLRSAEFSVGSSDNALVGANLKYKLFPKTTVYGQLVLDEFKLSEVTGGKGWWANKQSWQLGFRTFDLFGARNLDFQGEYNAVRPYTYSFRSTFANYEHYNQSLAHPLGANFQEVLGIATYKIKRWYGRGELMYAKYGDDPNPGSNYGHYIYKPYTNRPNDYGVYIGQGVKTNLLYAQGTIAYVLNPKYNLRVETSLAARRVKNDIEGAKTDLIFNIGLRSTFRQFYYDF